MSGYFYTKDQVQQEGNIRRLKDKIHLDQLSENFCCTLLHNLQQKQD